MKKILFVIDNLNIGGVEKSLITLLKNIDIKEYHVDILPLVSKGVLEEELNKMKISILPIPFSKYDTNLLSSSFKTTIINYFKKVSILKLFRLIELYISGKRESNIRNLKISELIRCSIINSYDSIEENYDVAVGYIDRQYSYFVANKVKANSKIMWIHSDYDVVGDFIKAYNSTYAVFHKIVSVSDKAKISFLKKFPAFADRIVVINDLLDIDKMNSSKPFDFSNEGINLISVGRLSPEKRVPILIDNFYKITLKTKEKLYLYIIGDGQDYDLIKKKIFDYKLNDKVFLLGRQNDPYQFVKSADIFLQPSIKEGYCLTVYEALYLKKFVIAFDIADVKKSIKNGHNGFICKNDDEFINNTLKTIENKLYKTKDICINNKYNVDIVNKVLNLFDESR